MTKEQIIKDILERMEDKGIAIENLSFDGDYKIKVNELEIHILLDDDIYKLQYQYAYTTSELKMLGWERV